MTPGPTEEAGKVAGLFFEIMRSQPLSLALVVMNVLLLGMFYIFITKIYERRDADMALLYGQNEKVQQMLFNCVPAPRQ